MECGVWLEKKELNKEAEESEEALSTKIISKLEEGQSLIEAIRDLRHEGKKASPLKLGMIIEMPVG